MQQLIKKGFLKIQPLRQLKGLDGVKIEKNYGENCLYI